LKIRKLSVRALGLGLAASAVFAMTACATASNGTPSDGSSKTAAVDPQVALTGAITKLAGTGFDLAMTNGTGLAANASVDPSTKALSFHAKGAVSGINVDINAIEVGTDVFAKADLGPGNAQFGIDPTQWYQVDASKITSSGFVPLDLHGGADMLGLTGLLTSVSGLKATDATHITGTVDLTKATGVNIGSTDTTGLNAVPFTVTLDDQGRLVEINVAAGDGKDATEDLKFTNYGTPTAITAPTGAVPLPDKVLALFNS
jgi:hypothetical protein